MKVTRVSVLPGVDPALKASLYAVSLERKSTNLVLVLNIHDRLQDAVEVLELFFEVLELRVVLVEELESLVSTPGPKPRVGCKALEELVDLVLGALDGTSQEQDDLNDLLVLGNPVVEGLTLLLRLVLLVPVLHFLGALEHMGSSTVNSGLHLLKRWLEHRLATLKVHVHFEEGLQDLLGGVPTATDTFLHLIKRVLGSVE